MTNFKDWSTEELDRFTAACGSDKIIDGRFYFEGSIWHTDDADNALEELERRNN